MKKTYSKPDIFFEDFSLSTNIAAGCEKKPFNHSEACAVRWGGLMLFTEKINCKDKIIDGDPEYNKLCYHVPSQSFNVFYS